MKWNNKSPLLIIALGFLWLYSLISIIFQPMLNDCQVFWSWAQQVKMSGLSGMNAIQSVWEIKGLFSRIWYYQLYSITSIFTPDIFPYGQYIFHFFGIVEFCLAVGLAIWLLPSGLMKKYEKYNSFYIITLAIFTLTPMANLQPEILGLAVVILSFSLLTRGSNTFQILGGILCGLLFFIKTPLILLAGSIFFAYSIIRNLSFFETIKNTWVYIVTAILFVIVCSGVIFHFYPQEIQDIRDASYFQSTLIQMNLTQVFRAWQDGFFHVWEMPTYLPAISFGLISLCVCFASHNKRSIIYLFLVWFFPYLYVTISNCYFQYHFATFLFPAFLSIFMTKGYWQGIIQNEKLPLYLIACISVGMICTHYKLYFLFRQVLILFFLFPIVCMFFTMSERYRNRIGTIIMLFYTFLFVSNNSALSHSYIESSREIKEELERNAEMGYSINQQLGKGTILRLDSGFSPIWFNNKSYLRHFYPLPIQRIEESSSISKSDHFIEEKNKLLEYSGDYIILDSLWFFGYPHKEVKEWIDNNYETVGPLYITINNGYNLYQRHPAIVKPISILKRKGL